MAAAAPQPAAAAKEPERFYYVSDKPEELQKYLNISNNGWDVNEKKWKFKIAKNLDKLSQELKKLFENINSLRLTSISGKVDINFDLSQLLNITTSNNISNKKLTLTLLDSTQLIKSLIDSFTNKQLLLDKLTPIAQNSGFRTQLTNLLEPGSGTAINNISLDLYFLNNYINTDKWEKITNKDKKGTYSKDSINPTTNKNIIDDTVQNVDKPAHINKYFKKCQEYQVYYNQKHNEIISFNNYLRRLIKLNMDILKIITDLLLLIRRKTKGSKAAKADVKAVKSLIDNIDAYVQQQNVSYNEIKNAFTNIQVNKVLKGGAGAAAPARRQLPTPPTQPKPPRQINITLDNNNNTLTLTNFNKDSSIQKGQHILILGELNTTGNVNPGIFAKKTGDNTYKIVKVLPAQAQDIITKFNDTKRDMQDRLIDVLEYYVDDDETMALIIQLRRIQVARYFSFQNIYSNMQERELLVDAANASQIVSKTTYNALQGQQKQGKTLEYTKENEEEIQTVLYHCYDLQVLYLLKHSEFINLFKVILYFLDTFIQLMILFEFILTLFDIFTTDIDDKPEEITLPTDFIPNIQEIIKAQQDILGGITQAGGAQQAPLPSAQYPAPTNDEDFITKLGELSGISKDILEGNKSKLSTLIDLIEEKMYKIDIGNADSAEQYKKLNKALLLAKYWLIKDVDNDKAPQNVKAKLLEKYKTDKPSTIDSELDYLSVIEDKAIRDVENTKEQLAKDREGMIKELTPIELKEQETKLSKTFANALLKLQEAEGKSTCTTREQCLTDEVKAYIGVIESYLDVEANTFNAVNEIQYHDELKKLVDYIKTQTATTKQIPTVKDLVDKKIIDVLKGHTSNETIKSLLDAINHSKQQEKDATSANARRKLAGVFRGAVAMLSMKREQQKKHETEYNTLYSQYETAYNELRTKLQEVLRREYIQSITEEQINKLKEIMQFNKQTKPSSITDYSRAKEDLTQQQEQITQHNRQIEAIIQLLDSHKPKTIGLLKEQTQFAESGLDVVIAIMSAFIGKTDEQQKAIQALLETGDLADAKTNFENIQEVYRKLDKDLPAIIDNDDTDISDNFEAYKQFIESAKTEYNTIKAQINDVAIANLYEIIGGAARTIVRIKPERDTDNSAPVIQKTNMATYTIKQYLQEKGLITQAGGYNYVDIINVQTENNNSIKIGNFCDGILPETSNTEYGPFSAIYPPQYNNFDIYANMFGADSITELRTQHTAITDFSLDKLELRDSLRTFNPVKNQLQNLMKKLSDNGSVVIFGYGFSGSGKTYSLIEGSRKDCIDVNCGKAMAGGAKKPARPSTAQRPATRPSTAAAAARPATRPSTAVAARPATRPSTAKGQAPAPATDYVKYDPSLLEQFIKNNADNILSVEFKEIYPLGIIGNPDIKVIQASPIPADANTFTTAELINEEKYNAYKAEIDANNLLGDDALFTEGKTKAQAQGQYDLYKTINLQEIAGVGAENKYYLISNRIRMLERHRIHKLRILATPNNDNSSRSFLQITLNIKPKDGTDANPQLVFFDMPGTENTVRIKTEFMGADIFSEIKTDDKDKKLNLLSDLDPNQINVTQERRRLPYDYLYDFFNNKDDKVFKYRTDISNYVDIYYSGYKIFKINKKKNIEDGTDTKIKIAINTLLFKYVFMQMQTFELYCGINIFKDNLFISKIGLELTTFFNRQDADEFNKITNNTNLYFLTDANYNKIFDKFMTFLQSNVGGNNKYYSYSSNKYCKIKFTITDILSENEQNEFLEIFGINPTMMSETARTEKKVKGFIKLDGNLQTAGLINQTMTNIFKKDGKLNTHFFVPNPLFKYLLIAFYNIFVNVNVSKTTDKNSGLTKEQILIRASVFFIYKFINFIVNQGRGIVTNLEHLKFFFLSRTGQITTYNNSQTDQTKQFNFTDAEEVLKKPKIYTVGTKIIDSKKNIIELQERVNMGQMETYRLLSVLQDLAKSNPDLSRLWDGTKSYIDIMKSTDGTKSSALGAIFVMFTNIKVFLDKETDKISDKTNTSLQAELNKLCTAEYDTLEFAESISSATRTKAKSKPLTKTPVLEQGKHTIADILHQQPVSGGAIKHYRKFNIKDLLPKHNIYRRTKKVKSIKRINHTRPQRTKKNG